MGEKGLDFFSFPAARSEIANGRDAGSESGGHYSPADAINAQTGKFGQEVGQRQLEYPDHSQADNHVGQGVACP
jgi:hypothetical protein